MPMIGTIGSPVIVECEPNFAIKNVALIKFQNSRVCPEYIHALLSSNYLEKHLVIRSRGGTQKFVSLGDIRKLEIPLPPLEEQKRIAAILDQADALRRLRQRAIDRLNTLGQAIFYEMFGDVSRNSKNWALHSLKDLVLNLDGQRIPIKLSERKNIPGIYPYYGASGIIDYVEDYIFEGPHLLIGEDGANLIARSSPIAFIALGRFWVNNHAHVLQSNGKVELNYLEYFLESTDLKPYVSGSAQPKLNQAQLNRIPVPLPPLEIQKQFVMRLEFLGKLKESALLELNEHQRLFSSLQHRAFRGEL